MEAESNQPVPHQSMRNRPMPCPVQKVLRANRFGLVIQSHQGYEIGEEMTLGFHLPRSGGADSFLSAETLVVDSSHCLSDRGNFRHQITLLFIDISDEDLVGLIELTESESTPSPEQAFGLN